MGVKKAILTTAVGVAIKPETTPFWLPLHTGPWVNLQSCPCSSFNYY